MKNRVRQCYQMDFPCIECFNLIAMSSLTTEYDLTKSLQLQSGQQAS